MDATSRQQRLRGLLLALALCVEGALADIQPSFVWGFNSFKGTSLPECARLQIFVGTSGTGITTAAQPPYTLIAYEAGGITTTQMVGNDLTNLWWNVDHAAGTQLVLSMADVAGNAGGVAEDLYTVAAGTSTTCHPQVPTSPVSITTNTTKTLKSCDVLPLKISGGKKPYTITVAAIGSSSVTNVTLGPAYDTYNWVNRAAPNSQILGTVSDANGVYAAGTGLLMTTGSTDLTCGGLQSTQIDSTGQASAISSGTAGVTAASTASGPTATSNSGSGSGSSKGTLIGAIAGGAVLIGALIIGAVFFLKRRKSKPRGPRPYVGDDPYNGFGLGKVGAAPGQGPDYMNVGSHAEEVTPFVMAGGQSSPYRDHYPPYNNNSYSSATSETSYGAPLHPRASTYSTGALSLPPGVSPPPSAQSFDPYNPYAEPPAGSSSGPSTYSAAMAQPIAGSSSGPGSVSGSGSVPMAGPSTSTGQFAVANPGAQEQQDVKQGAVPPQGPQESIYQHEDISDVVELPPAYKERD